jgi:hypothetical protein
MRTEENRRDVVRREKSREAVIGQDKIGKEGRREDYRAEER